jgi:type IV secretion system protein TrbL
MRLRNKEAGQDKRNEQEMSASEPFAGGEPHPDAPPVPVNAVPAPEPVSAPSGSGGQGSTAAPAPGAAVSGGATMDDVVEQLKQMQGQPKAAVDKLKDGFIDRAKSHMEGVATGNSRDVPSGGKISTDHMRDFD